MLLGSSLRHASKIASETWSHILSEKRWGNNVFFLLRKQLITWMSFSNTFRGHEKCAFATETCIPRWWGHSVLNVKLFCSLQIQNACSSLQNLVLLYKYFSINNYYITSFTKNNQWLSWYHVMKYFTHWTTDYIHILLENNSKLTAIIYKKIMSSSKSFQLMFNYFQNTFSKYFPLQHVQPQIVATGGIDQNIGKVHSLLRLPNCV